MAELSPHPIHVDDAALADLRRRLAQTRWPEPETVDDWSQGIPLAYVQELCGYWAERYDWRRVEAELNGFEQLQFRRAELDGLGIHFLHARSPNPDALPLVLTHGWPGSVRRVPRRDRAAARSRSRTAAMPPTRSTSSARRCPATASATSRRRTGWGIERIADAWTELMAALGYDRFGAQGGDWGSAVTTALGVQRPGSLRRHPPEHGLGAPGRR